MQTPDTPAGRLTERIMARVREKLPKLETHEYNRTYEAVLEVLNEIPVHTTETLADSLDFGDAMKEVKRSQKVLVKERPRARSHPNQPFYRQGRRRW